MHHRAGIVTGVAIVACLTAAASARAQDLSNVVALPMFKDLPSLPVAVDSVPHRYGEVSTLDGTEKGDLRTEPIRRQINTWMKPTGMPPGMDPASMMQGGGAVTPAAAQAMGTLAQTAAQLNADLSEAQQSYHLATTRLEQTFDDKRTALTKQYQPAIAHCLGELERAYGHPCTNDPQAERDSAINVAAGVMLRETAAPYNDYKAKLQQVAARGEAAIDQAKKAMGGGPAPGMVQIQIRMIRTSELNALMAALEGESDVVSYVFEHAANMKEGGK